MIFEARSCGAQLSGGRLGVPMGAKRPLQPISRPSTTGTMTVKQRLLRTKIGGGNNATHVTCLGIPRGRGTCRMQKSGTVCPKSSGSTKKFNYFFATAALDVCDAKLKRLVAYMTKSMLLADVGRSTRGSRFQNQETPAALVSDCFS